MLRLLFCLNILITCMVHIHIKKELRFNDGPNSFITIVYLFLFNAT